MKKLLLVAVLGCSLAASAEYNRSASWSGWWSPIGVEFVSLPFQIPFPAGSVYGVRTCAAGFYMENMDVMGIDVSVVGVAREAEYGIQAGGVNIVDGTCAGIQAGLIDCDNAMYGLQVGAVNLDKAMYGMQVGVVNVNAEDCVGLALGALNIDEKSFMGISIGAVNVADEAEGIQIGVVNYAKKMHGLQLGVFNAITTGNTIPLMILMNGSF